MGVANRDREGVGRIRRQFHFDGEQMLHHVRHLGFLRPPTPTTASLMARGAYS
jgi:hypothetical protein